MLLSNWNVRARLSFISLICVTLWCTQCSLLSAAQDAPGQADDLIRLMRDGQIEAHVVADHAYAVQLRLTNLTDHDLKATLTPGTVADTLARHPVFAQVGGGGSSSGGQSLGMLQSPTFELGGGQTVFATLGSACLNYGIPEPTAGSVLTLKPISELSASQPFANVLQAIARKYPNQQSIPADDVATAQAALWHFSDQLSWKQLRQMTVPKMPNFARATDQANILVQQIVGSESSYNPRDQLPQDGGFGKVKSRLVMGINLDPTGSPQVGSCVDRVVGSLQKSWPTVDVSARSYLAQPKDATKSQVQLHVLVKLGIDREKRARQAMNRLSKEGRLTETIPVTQVKIVRSEWLPKQQRWQSDRPVVINVEKNRDPMTIDECANWLMQGVCARLVDLKETGRTVTLRNRSPLPISKCVVATGSDSETLDEMINPEKSASIKLKTPASAIRAKISQLEFGDEL